MWRRRGRLPQPSSAGTSASRASSYLRRRSHADRARGDRDRHGDRRCAQNPLHPPAPAAHPRGNAGLARSDPPRRHPARCPRMRASATRTVAETRAGCGCLSEITRGVLASVRPVAVPLG